MNFVLNFILNILVNLVGLNILSLNLFIYSQITKKLNITCIKMINNKTILLQLNCTCMRKIIILPLINHHYLVKVLISNVPYYMIYFVLSLIIIFSILRSWTHWKFNPLRKDNYGRRYYILLIIILIYLIIFIIYA